MNKATVIEKLLTHRDDAKSKIFLYPLLQLPKSAPAPIGTYLKIEGVDFNASKKPLVCLYHKDSLKLADRNALAQNRFFDFSITDDEYEFIFFDFQSVSHIYDTILNGQYTKLSLNSKFVIAKQEHPIADIAIHPENY
jgi:hypothetical protein